MERVYQVIVFEHENGGRASVSQNGVFSSKEKASVALESAFHTECDRYGVKELNNYSYFSEEDSFRLDSEDCEFEVYGEVIEIEMDKLVCEE